jgi:hypothetical protein
VAKARGVQGVPVAPSAELSQHWGRSQRGQGMGWGEAAGMSCEVRSTWAQKNRSSRRLNKHSYVWPGQHLPREACKSVLWQAGWLLHVARAATFGQGSNCHERLA